MTPEARDEFWNPLRALVTDDRHRDGAQAGVSAELLATVLARATACAASDISRAEIAVGRPRAARMVDRRPITQPTVSKAVVKLLGEGLLGPGRLVLKAGHWVERLCLGTGYVVAGVHVIQHRGAPVAVTTVLCDLGATTVLGSRQDPIGKDVHDPWGVLAQTIHHHVDTLYQHLRTGPWITPPELLGVGVEVGAPVIDGTVSPVHPTAEIAPIDLRGRLQKLFHAERWLPQRAEDQKALLPIVIENDIAALAALSIRELHYAPADLVVAAVFEYGVGGGLVMDGRLRRGFSGKAMEIGHLVVGYPPGWTEQPDGVPQPNPAVARWKSLDPPARCPCGQLGHVDGYATPASIRSALIAAADAAGIDVDRKADLATLSRFGCPDVAAQILATAGAALGRALAHVCNVVDTGELVVYVPGIFLDAPTRSPIAEYMRSAIHEVREAFAVRGLPTTRIDPRPLPPPDGPLEQLCARAAAACLLETLIEEALELDDPTPKTTRKSAPRPARRRSRDATVPAPHVDERNLPS
ncbi:ROK family protein [Nocardia vinacea]|uniref:ROK family protein n=1 Tax=Nocardia vinacea TaxID=96468 RepID=UPI00341A6387